ncbi:hypothetical protein [Pedobacter arcticus]|uniref:hypothetical protein n=1 Tax=Pedobacter arcticus TaxID=752140 RepID=UPI0002EF73F8|nr:hypothetical protein [Pedobacter arcticus]
MKTLLKSAMLFFALVLTNSLSFASAKIPDVYVSRSSLTNLGGAELLNTNWFWILVALCVLVALCALISTKDQEEVHAPAHTL